MICNNCKCKKECSWYDSYQKIKTEIQLGIGTDDALGRALDIAMEENPLEECEYFE